VSAGETRVICATVAFGLGMDLPEVGLIVHWDAATSLQVYVQQIGRGGRCGCECLCITFYDRAFLKGAMRQAESIGDVARRDAELGSIQQVRCSSAMYESNVHVQPAEEVLKAGARMVSGGTATVPPQLYQHAF
jgi:superfamily II DNA helicase RecQ